MSGRESVPALCGINRIWVHSKHRRQGIASRLVDAARDNFLYGRVLCQNEIAFSQPTEDGRSFGKHYVGPNRTCCLTLSVTLTPHCSTARLPAHAVTFVSREDCL